MNETLRSVRHVDVVKNEWLAGFQHVVARVSIEDGGVRIDTDDHDRWDPILLRPFADPQSGDEVRPDQGEEFVSRLHKQLRGDYLFATELHEESVCPFHDRLVVPIKPAERQRAFLTA